MFFLEKVHRVMIARNYQKYLGLRESSLSFISNNEFALKSSSTCYVTGHLHDSRRKNGDLFQIDGFLLIFQLFICIYYHFLLFSHFLFFLKGNKTKKTFKKCTKLQIFIKNKACHSVETIVN